MRIKTFSTFEERNEHHGKKIEEWSNTEAYFTNPTGGRKVERLPNIRSCQTVVKNNDVFTTIIYD